MKGSRFIAYHVVIILVIIVFQFNSHAVATGEIERNSSEPIVTPQDVVNIGVIQNRNSAFGSMISLCLETAESDFYSAHPDYKTRVQLRIKDVEDALRANLAVRELLEQQQVHCILGDYELSQSKFVAQLGRKSKVPIVSFTSRSTADNEYFIRTAPDDAFQARALAAICRTYEWNNVVVLYEDSTYGLQFLSHLKRALQDVRIGLERMISIPTSANKTYLDRELRILNENQTIKVFLVHTSPSLGSRLFTRAKKMGMMREGNAWMITDWLTNFLNSVGFTARESMEGFVGVRPYVPLSKDLNDFRKRLKNNSVILDLNVYGLWAYDTLTALALTLEKIGSVVNSTSLYENLSNTSFKGLSGDFELVGGIRKPSPFEIINIFGTGERRLGFWTVEAGITTDLNSSSSLAELKKVVWPGDSVTRPKGWSIPPMGPLRIGVPGKSGFTEFTKVTNIDQSTNISNATGFAIDIFLSALKALPFPIDYRFICYNGSDSTDTNWTYDDMIGEIPAKKFDMIVGDTTILASRSKYVDFSLPYAGSVVVLLVKNTKELDQWTFTKPLRWDLWLAILVSCIVLGIVIRILERPSTNPTTDESPKMTYLTPIAILAFNERNMVSNKWSHFVLVCWLSMAYILMQSFTANLSAILTVDQLINASPDQYRYIGCQNISFVKQFLMDNLHIDESKLKYYSSPQKYHEAMQSGDIEAIVDEIPYMRLLVNRYDDQYKIVKQLMNKTGLGFAFPVGSPLASYFSKAILNVTQGPEMTFIERKNFGPGYSSQDPLSSTLSQGTSSLSFYHFAGLFIIVGSSTLIALIYSERAVILRALIRIARQSFNGNNVDRETGKGHADNANEHGNGDEPLDNGEQGSTQDEHDNEQSVELDTLSSEEANDVRDIEGESIIT